MPLALGTKYRPDLTTLRLQRSEHFLQGYELMGRKSNSSLSFEEGINLWKKRGDTAEMEPVNLAMWPGDAQFGNDISDSALFNERFIESQLDQDKLLDDTYMVSMWHTFCLVTVAASVITNVERWPLVFPYLLFSSFFFLSMAALTRPGGRIRFNRQAQLVQTVDGSGNVVSVPWRAVQPFFWLRMHARVGLRLGFPPPPDNKAKIYEQDGVLWLDGRFDALDDMRVPSAALRFEFIRRYMEEGLDAIQPTADLPAYKKPSGMPRDPFFYWVGFGPLIDRWAAHHAAKFQWPDEVERLCAEGADLSAYDTTPVASNKYIFYRYDRRAGGLYLCDHDGVRLSSLSGADTPDSDQRTLTNSQ
ncbi:hypothetical protein [Achromobacter mucicolens]|uniref:hypothetical protein n=1 Tax=Achromobacter mucicolens TaxID=1389922 RepID=UPI003975B7F1